MSKSPSVGMKVIVPSVVAAVVVAVEIRSSSSRLGDEDLEELLSLGVLSSGT